jgi:hypothetical protein
MGMAFLGYASGARLVRDLFCLGLLGMIDNLR